jgi:hypothetical protein
MTKYTVEVTHDPTNTTMTFVLDTDDNDVLDEVFSELSVTALEIEE